MDKVLAGLSSIPATAWTAFGTALIAFFGVWLTNWNNRQSLKIQLEHEERLQRQRVAKERLEELYALVSQWRKYIEKTNDSLIMVLEGKKSFKEDLDALSAAENMHDFNRIEMIVGIYGEAIEAAFDEVLTRRRTMQEAINTCLRDYQKAKDEKGAALIKTINTAQTNLFKATAKLKTEIVKAAKEV